MALDRRSLCHLCPLHWPDLSLRPLLLCRYLRGMALSHPSTTPCRGLVHVDFALDHAAGSTRFSTFAPEPDGNSPWDSNPIDGEAAPHQWDPACIMDMDPVWDSGQHLVDAPPRLLPRARSRTTWEHARGGGGFDRSFRGRDHGHGSATGISA